MTISLDAISTAIAAKYTGLTPPTGYKAIRASTGDLPSAIPATPAVLVFPDEGEFISGNGVRQGHQNWVVRFYYEKAADNPRQLVAVRKWADVLIYVHLTGIQLGGLVAVCRLDGYQMGDLDYAGQSYAGLELRISTTTSEAWSATA